MGMSRYTRFKLRAHDNGIDRHNKGVSLLRKQSRLSREHQANIEAGKRQRAARVKGQRQLEAQKRTRQKMGLAALEEMTHRLFEAADIERRRLKVEDVRRPPATQRFPEKVKFERIPVTEEKTYRVRRTGEGVTEVQATVKGVILVGPTRVEIKPM